MLFNNGTSDKKKGSSRYHDNLLLNQTNDIDPQLCNFIGHNTQINNDDSSVVSDGFLEQDCSTGKVLSKLSNKKRFVWPDELQRFFIKAIFDIGLKSISTETISQNFPKISNTVDDEVIHGKLLKLRMFSGIPISLTKNKIYRLDSVKVEDTSSKNYKSYDPHLLLSSKFSFCVDEQEHPYIHDELLNSNKQNSAKSTKKNNSKKQRSLKSINQLHDEINNVFEDFQGSEIDSNSENNDYRSSATTIALLEPQIQNTGIIDQYKLEELKTFKDEANMLLNSIKLQKDCIDNLKIAMNSHISTYNNTLKKIKNLEPNSTLNPLPIEIIFDSSDSGNDTYIRNKSLSRSNSQITKNNRNNSNNSSNDIFPTSGRSMHDSNSNNNSKHTSPRITSKDNSVYSQSSGGNYSYLPPPGTSIQMSQQPLQNPTSAYLNYKNQNLDANDQQSGYSGVHNVRSVLHTFSTEMKSHMSLHRQLMQQREGQLQLHHSLNSPIPYHYPNLTSSSAPTSSSTLVNNNYSQNISGSKATKSSIPENTNVHHRIPEPLIDTSQPILPSPRTMSHIYPSSVAHTMISPTVTTAKSVSTTSFIPPEQNLNLHIPPMRKGRFRKHSLGEIPLSSHFTPLSNDMAAPDIVNDTVVPLAASASNSTSSSSGSGMSIVGIDTASFKIKSAHLTAANGEYLTSADFIDDLDSGLFNFLLENE